MQSILSRGIGLSRFSSLLAITITMFLLSLSAAAQNHYYVATSGSDSNNGTSPSTPWRTINHAVAAFTLGSGGTIIHVADGNYPPGNQINRGGSSTNVRMVLRCENGQGGALSAKGHCVINSGSGVSFMMGGANYYDIVGFDIGNNPNLMTAFDGLVCGSATQSSCNNSAHIIGNYIHDLGQNVPTSGGCAVLGDAPGAILLLNHHGFYVTDTQIIGNAIINWGIPSSTSCNEMHGIYIDTKGATITNNLVIKVPTFGIQYYGQPCGGVISNNTIITNKSGMTVSGNGEGICNPGLMTINNNVMLNSLVSKVGQISGFPCTSGTPTFWGNNISDGVGADVSNAAATSCNTISGGSFAHASGASLFVNYKTDGTGDYHLKAGSPAIAAGTTQCVNGGIEPCVPTSDIASFARPNTPSLGVFESDTSTGSAPSAPSGLTAQVQ